MTTKTAAKFAAAATAAQVTFDAAARAYQDAPSLEARWKRDRALSALLLAREACWTTRR
jgi:hypothetical protein